MRSLAKLIYDAPDALRSRLGRNLVGAAEAGNAVIPQVLGNPGTANAPSRPGQAPHKRSGQLLAQTRFVAAASKLEIKLLTSDVGKILNQGSRRMAARPWVAELVRKASPLIKAALHRK